MKLNPDNLSERGRSILELLEDTDGFNRTDAAYIVKAAIALRTRLKSGGQAETKKKKGGAARLLPPPRPGTTGTTPGAARVEEAPAQIA